MGDFMICPFCGGTIFIDAGWDEGCCDTCPAVYKNGKVYETEEDMICG